MRRRSLPKARRMSIPAANLLSPADWYRTIRDQIQHEDNLIVQRLSWLMAAQSFFFTGYAIIANASPQARSPLLAKQQDLLFNIIPAVACISDILIFCSVIAGVLALGRLRRAYAAHVDAVGGFPEILRKPAHTGVGNGLSDSSPLGFFDRLVDPLEQGTSLICDACASSFTTSVGQSTRLETRVLTGGAAQLDPPGFEVAAEALLPPDRSSRSRGPSSEPEQGQPWGRAR